MKSLLVALTMVFGTAQLVAPVANAYYAEDLNTQIQRKESVLAAKRKELSAKEQLVSAKNIQVTALSYKYGRQFGTRQAIATSIALNSAKAEYKSAVADRDAVKAEIGALEAEIGALKAQQ